MLINNLYYYIICLCDNITHILGCNGLVYLSLNKTIRNKVIGMFRMKRKRRATCSSLFMPMSGFMSVESKTEFHSIRLTTLTEPPESVEEL